MASRVKVTVLRRLYHADLVKEYAVTQWQPCNRLKDGAEFVTGLNINMPEGFCSWAWTDIFKYVLALAQGGEFPSCGPGMTLACCSDAYRPVIFKIERMPDEPAAK